MFFQKPGENLPKTSGNPALNLSNFEKTRQKLTFCLKLLFKTARISGLLGIFMPCIGIVFKF